MLSKTYGCFKETIRSQDKFGKPVQLKFQNKNSVKSFIGGFLTLCIQFGILSYLIVQLKQVWDLSEIKIIQSIFQRNLLTDDYEIKLTEKNFDLALYLTYAGQNNTIADEIDTYVNIQIFTVVSESSKGQLLNTSAQFSTQTWDLTPVPLMRCPSERMGGPGYSDTMAGLYWCPQYVNFTVSGHYQTNNKDIVVRIAYCDQSVLDAYVPGKTCKSKQETNSIIGAMAVRLATLTQFTDLRAFGDDRIKKTLTVYDSGLNDILAQAMYFKISENTVKFKDSIISNTLNNEDFTYINVKLSQITTQSTQFRPGFLGGFLFLMDEDVKVSQRTVQTVFDVFAQCGGLLGTLTVFCALIVSKYEEIVYQQQLIRSLYTVFDQKTFLQIKRKLNKSSPTKPLDKKDVLLADIQSRIPLFIRLKEWVLFKSCFKNNSYYYRSDKLNTALMKLNKELDIVQLIKAKRDFKNLLKLTMSPQFKQLLRFSKESLIDPNNKNQQQLKENPKSIDSKIDKIFKEKDKRKNKNIINLLFEGVNRQSLVLLDDQDNENKQSNEVEEMFNSQRQKLNQSSRLQLLDFEGNSSAVQSSRKKKQSAKSSKKKDNQDSLDSKRFSKDQN